MYCARNFEFSPTSKRMVHGVNEILIIGILYYLGRPQTIYDLGFEGLGANYDVDGFSILP
jgi:hypothetical protein